MSKKLKQMLGNTSKIEISKILDHLPGEMKITNKSTIIGPENMFAPSEDYYEAKRLASSLKLKLEFDVYSLCCPSLHVAASYPDVVQPVGRHRCPGCGRCSACNFEEPYVRAGCCVWTSAV